MELNKEQKLARDCEKKHIVVSAGAGSGKTAVLTKRIVRKINEGTNLDQLIVITFTKASAKEMKQRLIKALPDKINEIENATITNNDAFFLNFVSKFGYLIGKDSNISIISDNVYAYERIMVIEQLINNSENQEEILDFISVYFHGEKNKFIKEMASLHRSITDKIKLTDSFYQRNIDDQYLMVIKTLLKKMKDLVPKNSEDVLDIIDTIMSADNLKECVELFSENTKKITKGKIGETEENKKELKKYDAIRTRQLKEIIDVVKEAEDNKEIESKVRKVYDFIINFLLEVDKELEKIKEELNKYTYKDIMEMVIEILNYPAGEKRHELDVYLENINEIMVDEYQDTNQRQDQIIDLLTKKGATLFVVGDAKQSIYGFRDCSPQYFNKRAKQCKTSDDAELINLNTNYRSNKIIIDEINKIFENTMTESCGEVDYKDNHKLEAGNTTELDHAKVSGVIIDPDFLPDANIDIDFYHTYLIVKDIMKKKEELGISYSDFCLLSPKKSTFSSLKKICNYYKIPVSIQESDKNLDNPIVQVFINIINLLDDRDKDYHLYALLRSFLYQVSDYDLYQVYKDRDEINKKVDKEQRKKVIDKIDEIDGNIKPIILDVKEKIELIKKNITNYSLEYGLKSIFRVFNFSGKLSLLDNDIDFIQIIDKLNKLIEDFSQHNYSLTKTRKAIDTLLEYEIVDFILETNLEPDSIHACTIHYSKGLEYKHVYVLGLASKSSSDKNKLRFHPTIGVNADLYVEEDNHRVVKYNTMEKKLASELVKISEEHEQVRKFYVALTRSEETLNFYLKRKEGDELSGMGKYLNSYELIANKESRKISDEVDNQFSSEEVDEIKKIYYKMSEEVKEQEYEKYFPLQELLEVKVAGEQVEAKRASRDDVELLTEEQKMNMEKGDYIHNVLSTIDFTRLDEVRLEDEDINLIIDRMKNNELFVGIDGCYQEVEFYDEEQNIHGFIDLVVKVGDKYKIIDYKLSNIDDEKYDKQLSVYYDYFTKNINPNVECYLYSLTTGKYRKVK